MRKTQTYCNKHFDFFPFYFDLYFTVSNCTSRTPRLSEQFLRNMPAERKQNRSLRHYPQHRGDEYS